MLPPFSRLYKEFVMGITYSEVTQYGDIMPNFRHLLRFPNLSGVFDGNLFTVLHGNVTLPPLQVGQVTVKLLGWSVSFAGGRIQQPTFTVDLYEVENAPVVKSLAKWQDICSGFKSPLAKLKTDYAINPTCYAQDTTGKYALEVKLINVWPITITYGSFTEDSAPMQIQVEFSIDAVDIVGVATTSGDFETATQNSQSAPRLWYESTSGAQFQQAIDPSSFQLSDKIARGLGINGNSPSQVMGKFF